MKLVKKNSAHYKSQQKYLYYLQNIKVGDTVYPAYDGKGGRATACKVVDIKNDKLIVEGKFWGSDEEETIITASFDAETGEGWVVYKEGEPTLMDYMINKQDEEDGDFYQLIMFEGFDVNNGWFTDSYLKSLGLK
jgi:hypothetical protein